MVVHTMALNANTIYPLQSVLEFSTFLTLASPQMQVNFPIPTFINANCYKFAIHRRLIDHSLSLDFRRSETFAKYVTRDWLSFEDFLQLRQQRHRLRNAGLIAGSIRLPFPFSK